MRRIASAALLLLLAACEVLPELSPPTPPQQPARNAPPEVAVPPAPEVATIPPEGAPAVPPLSSERMDPKRLVGMTREQVTALIGPPKSVSDSPPATVWAYRTDGCSLDVMFYMDLGTRTFRALAYEVRPEQTARLAETDCLARIRASRDGR